jgi:hypothetical protein
MKFAENVDGVRVKSRHRPKPLTAYALLGSNNQCLRRGDVRCGRMSYAKVLKVP